MCTVSFVPTKEGFVFSSNRDEDVSRAANRLVEQVNESFTLYYPQDELAKGSWIAFSNTNRFVCILNGAFKTHQRKETYSMSRGIMALSFFDYPSISKFIESFEFNGMEPFTLILFDDNEFSELRWDENELHHKKLALDEVHLWSSFTLYTTQWWDKRSVEFADFVAQKSPTQQDIIKYHRNKLAFEPLALQDRIGVSEPLKGLRIETTSVSSIAQYKKGFSFQFQRMDDSIKLTKVID